MCIRDSLNDKGRSYVDFLKSHCVVVDVAAGLFKRISDVTVRNPLYESDWQHVVRQSTLGTHRPDRPVYLYHGVIDELIPYAVGKQLRADWCAKGATVQWKSLPLGEHVLGVIGESIPAANWLADRFAGRPTGGNC